MSVYADKRAFALGALFVAALSLAGCSSALVDMQAPGSPSDVAADPKEAGAYLPVHDLSSHRDEAVISPAERAKIQAELIAARDRQASAGTTQNASSQNATSQNSAPK